MNKYQKFVRKKRLQNNSVDQDKVYICYINEQKKGSKEFCARHHIKHKELIRHPWIYIKKWKVMFLLQHDHGNSNVDSNPWAYKFECLNKLTNQKEMCILRIDKNIRGIRKAEDIAFLESQHQPWKNNKSHYFWQYIELDKHLKNIRTLFNKFMKQKR